MTMRIYKRDKMGRFAVSNSGNGSSVGLEGKTTKFEAEDYDTRLQTTPNEEPMFREYLDDSNRPKLTAEEETSLGYYTGAGYELMNQVERGEIPEEYAGATATLERMRNHTNVLLGVLDRGEIGRDALLYRGHKTKSGDFTEKLVAGQEFKFQNITSTSLSRRKARDFGRTVIKIQARKNTRGIYADDNFRNFTREREFIVHPDTKYRVLSNTLKNGNREIELETID